LNSPESSNIGVKLAKNAEQKGQKIRKKYGLIKKKQNMESLEKRSVPISA
jgi:hypothetical protein